MIKGVKRKIWQYPWSYIEGIVVVIAIIFIGIILQLTVGSFEFFLLANPVNYILTVIVIVSCLIMGTVFRQSNFSKWFYGVSLAVPLMVALLFLSIIMGLTTQNDASQLLFGIDAMTSNWAFILIYLFTLLSLGTLIVVRFNYFNWQDYGFYLNHLGLWILLLSSALGYADMERYIMYVQEGETEWRVYDNNKNSKELPIAILLNDFDLDVYPPKLAIIDRSTGVIQPNENPQYFQIDTDIKQGKLNDWNIEIIEYIHEAVRNSDSTYHKVSMPGATPATKIVATRNGEKKSGWICGGNQAQLYMTLPLNDNYSVVMTPPEPREYTSNVEIFTESGKHLKTTISVNNPVSIGSWTIYQHGYDNNAGRLSSYSSFEIVYDSWLVPVYVGIIMMMLGSIVMLWTGRKKKGDKL